MVQLEKAYDFIKGNLKEKRFIHTLGVVSVAKKLADLNGVSEEKAEIAALTHDIAKNISEDDMKKLLKDENISLSPSEKMTKELWHSILAPVVAKNKLQIEDEEILSAIRWHTTGKENMSTLDKIIFIADMIEPSRNFKGVDEIRKITLEDLDKGVLLGLDHSIEYLIEKSVIIDINTVKARNYMLL